MVDRLVHLLTDWSRSPSDDTAILAIGNPGATAAGFSEARRST